MKKWGIWAILLVGLLAISGCGSEHEALPPDSGVETPDTEAGETLPQGSVQTFTWGDLVLEVTNVYEIRTESRVDDGGEPFEETVYCCGPGAVLRVLQADMSDPAYAADHQAHPQWGLYDLESDERVKIMDGMDPVALDETTDAVFNLESSLIVLSFELADVYLLYT